MSKKVVDVSAALIWQGEKFMICQRPENKTRALQWEFVGGKREEGETSEEALKRECQEEINVTVSVGDVFMKLLHEYEDIFVNLTLFNATIADGEVTMLEHNDIRWITAAEIDLYDFCPADKEILEKIKEKKGLKLDAYFKSIIDQDSSAVVVCNVEHTVIYMNPASIERYKRNIVGQSIKVCHNEESNRRIDEVVEWFKQSKDNNKLFTVHIDSSNKDVYMVALRDENKELIGYYEKHEYRNKEAQKPYNLS